MFRRRFHTAKGGFVIAAFLATLALGGAGVADAGMTREWTGGSELSQITYEEPHFMKEQGWMFGLFGGCTLRNDPQGIDPNGTVRAGLQQDTVIRMDARFGYGQVDYSSRETGKKTGNEDYTFETRAAFGYDLSRYLTGFEPTPYFGVGYRYLYDDLSGVTTTGHLGYERRSNYVYLPVGVDVKSFQGEGVALHFNLEYDVFVYGEQKSHLEDVDPECETLRNEQRRGHGVRGSVRLVRSLSRVNVLVEPFFRYWEIKDSDVRTFSCHGSAAGTGYEPRNTSAEYGLKLGLQF